MPGRTTTPTRSSEGFRSASTSRSGTITERSTLTSLNSHTPGNSSSSFRNTSRATANETLGSRRVYRASGHNHSGNYYPSYGVSVRLGAVSIGWGGYYSGYSNSYYNGYHGSHYGHNYSSWSSNVHYGVHAATWLVGNAYTIVPYHNNSYYSGYSSYNYHGTYCRVRRPYWRGLSWRYTAYPSGYGYSSDHYDNIYRDPFYDDNWGVRGRSVYGQSYNSAYDDGYDRGFENGADETSAYVDERRRDSVYSKSSVYKKKRSIDKRSTNASYEFELEIRSANHSFRNADYLAASKAYKEAVITAPNNADARFGLAISAFAEGKYTYASFNLRKGLSLNANKGELDLGSAFGGQITLQDYTDSLDSELLANPDDEYLMLLHGYVHLQNGDARLAVDSLDKLVSANPDDAVAKNLYSKALSALENK